LGTGSRCSHNPLRSNQKFILDSSSWASGASSIKCGDGAWVRARARARAQGRGQKGRATELSGLDESGVLVFDWRHLLITISCVKGQSGGVLLFVRVFILDLFEGWD
jgi:hypothetical protein